MSQVELSRSQIADAAGVHVQAVHNWVRRHSDFPAPAATGVTSLYLAAAVAVWLDERPIPRNAMRDGEPFGTSYGQRFRRRLGLPLPRTAAALAVREPSWQAGLDSLVSRVQASIADVALGEELLAGLLAIQVRCGPAWDLLLGNQQRGEWDALREAFRQLAAVCPELRPVLARLAREQRLRGLLRAAVQAFTVVSPAGSGSAASSGLSAAAAYDYLRGRFAAAATPGGDWPEYLTPHPLARMMVELADPRAGERVWDPCCGSAELLTAAADYARDDTDGPSLLSLGGSALGERSHRLALLAAAVHDVRVELPSREFNVLRGPLPQPTFEVAITNPPFNMAAWDHGVVGQSRWPFGAPPRHNANFAWLQYAAAALTGTGRAVVVMANIAAVSDDTAERAIRTRLIEAGTIRCIIALPNNLFFQTPAGATLWVLSRPRPDRKILFIDARQPQVAALGERVQIANADRIVQSYRKWQSGVSPAEVEQEGFSRLVTADEIARHGHRLNPAIYVGGRERAVAAADLPSLYAELTCLRKRAAHLDAAAEDRIEQLLHGMEHGR